MRYQAINQSSNFKVRLDYVIRMDKAAANHKKNERVGDYLIIDSLPKKHTPKFSSSL